MKYFPQMIVFYGAPRFTPKSQQLTLSADLREKESPLPFSILNNNWYNTILRRISTRPKTYDRIFHHILKKIKTQKMYWKKIH